MAYATPVLGGYGPSDLGDLAAPVRPPTLEEILAREEARRRAAAAPNAPAPPEMPAPAAPVAAPRQAFAAPLPAVPDALRDDPRLAGLFGRRDLHDRNMAAIKAGEGDLGGGVRMTSNMTPDEVLALSRGGGGIAPSAALAQLRAIEQQKARRMAGELAAIRGGGGPPDGPRSLAAGSADYNGRFPGGANYGSFSTFPKPDGGIGFRQYDREKMAANASKPVRTLPNAAPAVEMDPERAAKLAAAQQGYADRKAAMVNNRRDDLGARNRQGGYIAALNSVDPAVAIAALRGQAEVAAAGAAPAGQQAAIEAGLRKAEMDAAAAVASAYVERGQPIPPEIQAKIFQGGGASAGGAAVTPGATARTDAAGGVDINATLDDLANAPSLDRAGVPRELTVDALAKAVNDNSSGGFFESLTQKAIRERRLATAKRLLSLMTGGATDRPAGPADPVGLPPVAVSPVPIARPSGYVPYSPPAGGGYAPF